MYFPVFPAPSVGVSPVSIGQFSSAASRSRAGDPLFGVAGGPGVIPVKPIAKRIVLCGCFPAATASSEFFSKFFAAEARLSRIL